MSHRRFEEEEHVKLYSKYRLVPPENLIQQIVDYTTEKCTHPLDFAVDVGCGPGISTQVLAKHFDKVLGTDISEAMVAEARDRFQLKNVTFLVSPAESIPVEDSSVQLITASHAAHWFDLPKFFDEAKRVLCPGGVVAFYGYGLLKVEYRQDTTKNKELLAAVHDLFKFGLNTYNPPELQCMFDRYTNLYMPLADKTRDDSIVHEVDITVTDLLRYITTWSPYQGLCNKEGNAAGETLLSNFEKRVMTILKVDTAPNETMITKKSEFFIVLGRNF